MDCVYQIDYFLRYSDAFEKGTARAFVKAPAGLEGRRGELERLCRAKIHEDLKIDRWEKIDVVDVTEAKSSAPVAHNIGARRKPMKTDKTKRPDYYETLGKFMNAVYDHPYGRGLAVNAYRTKSLDEVRIVYRGEERVEDAAAAVSKAIEPFGYAAEAVEPYVFEAAGRRGTYNIKLVKVA